MKAKGARRLKPWPANKPLPKFKSHVDEERFWLTHEIEDGPPDAWEPIIGPRPPKPPRTGRR